MGTTFKAFVLACCCAVSATPALAGPDILLASKVYPLLTGGKLTGGQVGFLVARDDNEFNGGRPALANGLLILMATDTRVALRLGVATDSKLEKFVPPERGYLFGNFKSNSPDLLISKLCDDPTQKIFVFGFGEATDAVFRGFLKTGAIEVAYGPPMSSLDAHFVVDLTGQPDTLKEWSQCVQTALKQASH